MQSVYKADHLTEAQIVVDVLAGEDIPAWIRGGGLSGAVGELPALGLVDVMTDDADVAAAREAIARWKATPVEPEPAPAAARRSGCGPLVLGVLVGALFGTLATYAVLRRPSSDRVDFDDDGHPEETWVYAGDAAQRIDFDRNSDGEIDARQHFGPISGEWRSEQDDDFDGRLETVWLHVAGNPVASRADRDGDGFDEWQNEFRDGVLVRSEYRDAKLGAVTLELFFAGNLLVRSKIDTDGDGVLDQERTHDARGEIESTRPIGK